MAFCIGHAREWRPDEIAEVGAPQRIRIPPPAREA
jgi:hypothetical protein